MSDKRASPKAKLPHHLQTFTFSEEKWNAVISIGTPRSKQKGPFESTRDAREDATEKDKLTTHELGMVGEAVFARLIGQSINDALLINGDGKFDFVINGVKFDVKASAHFDEPWLRVIPKDLSRADAFALVAVDEEGLRARYCGYALRAAVAVAPLRDMHDKMPDSHVLLECQLIRSLPPRSRPG